MKESKLTFVNLWVHEVTKAKKKKGRGKERKGNSNSQQKEDVGGERARERLTERFLKETKSRERKRPEDDLIDYFLYIMGIMAKWFEYFNILFESLLSTGLIRLLGGRNNNHRKKTTTVTSACLASSSDGILNVATPCGDVAMKDVSPSVVEETVAMECPVVNNLDVGPNPPLPTQDANATAGNAPGKPSYATTTGKTSGNKVSVHTLCTPEGNRIDVVVPVDSIMLNTWGKYRLIRSMFSSSTGLFSFQFSSMDGLDAMLENGPWFIWNNPIILKKWHPDENLLKEDVCIVPVWVKLYGVPITAFNEDGLSAITTKLVKPLMLDSYTSDMCMQSWGRSSYVRVIIELRSDVELKDNIFVAMPTITREGHYTCNVCLEYEWKPPKCSACKGFGHIHEECLKNTSAGEKKTPTASSSCNKKNGVEPIIEVSNSNQFDVLNSVNNDGEFGTNSSNTPIGIVESDSEVEVVFNETANLRISTSGKDGSDKGYGTNILLEQRRDSYLDNYDYDPYDDDMYENHDLSKHLQSICDDLDITVHGKKKK
ncbi:nucleotide-diphospho-sugar transferase [Tanacetum coccineum]